MNKWLYLAQIIEWGSGGAMRVRTGPLSDVRIIDCTMALAGPFGTAMLADLGADVIKVEPPNGDVSRSVSPLPPDYANVTADEPAGVDYGGYFASINRNKRSIVLDLKDEADKEVLLQLCEQADAIVENMRVGVMDRLGLLDQGGLVRIGFAHSVFISTHPFETSRLIMTLIACTFTSAATQTSA